MKLEVGKKYRIEDSDKPWEVVAIDSYGFAWGLVDGLMRHGSLVYIISEWQDKPDPGEGWRLLHPDEDVEEGDEYFSFANNTWLKSGSSKTCGGKQGKFIYRRRITPQYVPYTWEDREELRGRWYRKKGDNCEFLVNWITHHNKNEIRIGPWDADNFLNDCEWIDGSPCGKKVM